MKRTVFLAVALFALMAVGLYAQTEADFGVSKSKDGKSITIDKYKGKATEVNIPAKIQNLPVTEIGSNAFPLMSEVTSVTIPDSVTTIVDSAFYGCPTLTSVTFQGTIPVKNFNDDAFEMLGDIRAKFYATDKNNGTPGTYTRPDGNSTTWTKGASAAAAPAYDGTKGLAFTLTSDGKGYNVKVGANFPTSEANLVIPATYNNLPVTIIASMGFSEAVNLSSVTIPASVTLINSSAFMQCTRLKSVTFGGANTSFSSSAFPDGDLFTKYKAGGAGTYTRPDANSKTWTKK